MHINLKCWVVLERVYALDKQCTSECCRSVTWSLPISFHSAENIWEFRGLALTKLTIFTVVSKASFKLSGITLAERAARGCCSVPKWRREQLLARALPLHYVSLSWLLHHQYRYQHEQQLRWQHMDWFSVNWKWYFFQSISLFQTSIAEQVTISISSSWKDRTNITTNIMAELKCAGW